jgi:dipeptidyl aminopeptidase/acylaminoacyl peptidase
MLLAKSTGSLWQEYSEYDPASKKLTPLFGQDEKEEYVAEYASAPDEVLVATRKLGEFRRLYRWKAGNFTPVSPDIKHDVTASAIDHARTHLYYEVNDGGFTRLFALDAKTYKEAKLPPIPQADHVRVASLTRDGRYASISVTTSKAPPTSHVLDWTSGKLTQWHLPSAPEIDTTRFAAATLESYPARDGTKIPMLVRRPDGCDKAADPCPVVVAFHGGPEAQALPGFNTRAQLFVDQGFVYAEPNVRGSEGYGKTWTHADDGPKRLAVITDIEDASKFVRSAWAKNGKTPKVGVYGGSYGGYSTLVAMTMFAGAYDAGASIVGISSLVTFLENTAPYRRALRASEYGDLEKDKEALVKLSPITYIDKVNAPLLIVQGASDPRVPVGEAIQFHDALEARHVANRLIIFPDEGHGSQKRENRVLEMGHVLQFFEKHLK